MSDDTQTHQTEFQNSPSLFHETTKESFWVTLKIEDWLTVLIMSLLALITFANVLTRYFTSASLAWTEEISVFLMIILALIAGSAAFARDTHIRIEYFSRSGSLKRQLRLAQLGALMVALLFALMAVLSARLAWDDFRFEETSPGIGVPQWWYSVWLPIISAGISLRALGLLIRHNQKSKQALVDPSTNAAKTTSNSTPQASEGDQK